MTISNQWIDNAIISGTTYADEKAYHALFAKLRRDDPLHWTEPQGVRPFWAVTRYADIIEVERQNKVFINEPRMTLDTVESEELIRRMTGGRNVLLRTMLTMDGEEHRAYRALTQQWFTPKKLAEFEEDIRELADRFLNKMDAMGGFCDFAQDVAEHFPLQVIMRLLGLPPEDDQRMLTLTQELLGSRDPRLRLDESEEAIVRMYADFMTYFGSLAEDRRLNPCNDIVTIVANAKIDGKPLSAVDMASYCIIILAAGHDTTSSSSAGGLLALLQHPQEFQKLKDNPDLLPLAVDEMIRWVTPAKHFFRTATEDYELGGKTIRAGHSLMMCYPSANRDEEVFAAPFEFKVDRSPNRHLSFGYGAHQCLGQFLAKIEMRTLFRKLLERVETIELAGKPVRADAVFMNGLKQLPIRYHMREMAA